MSSSDEKQSTIAINESKPDLSSSSQVILHDPTKQKIVLYNPRSQQVSLCQLRWYHYNNDRPINVSKLLLKINGNTRTTNTSNNNNSHNNINPRINNRFNICPLCHQDLPSIYQSISMSPTFSSSDHMHRDYFMLLDRSYASDSRRTSRTSSNSTDEEKIYNNYNENNENNEIDGDALNNGYYNKFFQKVKKLGSGSYGTVHLVKHVMHKISLGLFAIKIICVGDKLPRLIEILREVRALQRLHHRNVIDYKHSWLENYQPAINGPLVPTLFILMEYADCGNIMDYIMNNEKSKPKWLSEHEIWTIMFETCMGLQHLHEYGIVHRDLKPNNLLMTSLHTRHRIDFEDLELYNTNYRIVLSDLGQSEFLDSSQRINNRTGNTGTLGFAAPELIFNNNNNECEWDESVDIWSLGHLLYFLCFSRWPYDGITTDECELYNGIINNKYRLEIPHDIINNGWDRSCAMIQLIDQLCCVNKTKRPSLNWIIMKISNILKERQYNMNNMNMNNMALPPPQSVVKADLSLYPVVKYVPKSYNKLRRRHNHKQVKYNNDDDNYDADDNDNDNDDEDIINDKNDKELLKMRKQFEMTMFVTMEKPIKFIVENKYIPMSIGLIVKMELIFKYIGGYNNIN